MKILKSADDFVVRHGGLITVIIMVLVVAGAFFGLAMFLGWVTEDVGPIETWHWKEVVVICASIIAAAIYLK